MWTHALLPCSSLHARLRTFPPPPPHTRSRSLCWAPPLLLPLQVQDSEEGADGAPPRHCVVSGATREEMTGWLHRRISQTKAHDQFGLGKFEISTLPCELQYKGAGIPTNSYLLADVKRKCLQSYGSWQAVERSRERSKQWHDE